MNDELDREDLDAWEVEPLNADFEDRVMEAWDRPHPTVARRRSRGVVWAAAISFAAAVSIVALWPRGDAGGDAATDDAITIRAGASAQVDYVPLSHQAEQTRGTVTYRVRSGTPFVVHTSAADITVHGTDFTVEMLTMQDERRRKYLGAGVLVLGGAAVAVSVTSGEVAVHNAHGRTEVLPGETAVASEHSAPRSEPRQVVAKAKRARINKTTITPSKREEIKRRLADALAERGAGTDDVPQNEDGDAPGAEGAVGSLDKDYITGVVQEDLKPIAKECYQRALEGSPDLAGTVLLRFSIAGDESVGGIVDEVSFADGVLFESDDTSPPPPEGTHVDTLPPDAKAHPKLPLADNPEFAECLSESTASLLFDPPEGGGRVEVMYPFVFTRKGDAPTPK